MRTIKELSEQLKVTPQSVRNEVERQSISTMKSKGSRGFFVSDEDADRIIAAFRERQAAAAAGKPKPKSKQENDLLLFLQKEIETKNTLIEQLTQQNAALTAALENTTASLHAAQALHAGTIQERLETKDGTITEPQQETDNGNDLNEQETAQPKKSFWQRLFGK